MDTRDMNINEKLADLLQAFIGGSLTEQQAQEQARQSFEGITADELMAAEQMLKQRGIDDEVVYSHIDSFLSILQDVLVSPELHLAEWHPIRTYRCENEVLAAVIRDSAELKRERFVPNQWAEVMEKLMQFDLHLARKQNQLYPAFERQGFDRPSKIMWSLDDEVHGALKTASAALENDDAEFLTLFDKATALLNDLMEKENTVLLPAALEMIPYNEFLAMRKGDDEIGYCLIDKPEAAPDIEDAPEAQEQSEDNSFMAELKQLLHKHNIAQTENELDMRQGKLTLEQINLIFQHIPIDISFVDENELVRFYSDTKHRIFPRSPGVIGREVKNCHPRESVHMVEQIVQAFRDGSEDEAEFWLEKGGQFIYIRFIAVRDEAGSFKGVLETMQDATHIRALEGSQLLLSWGGSNTDAKQDAPESKHGLTPDITIGQVVKEYPFIRAWLTTLSPAYKKLTNPVAFKAMAGAATLQAIAQRGGFTASELIAKIDGFIASHKED